MRDIFSTNLVENQIAKASDFQRIVDQSWENTASLLAVVLGAHPQIDLIITGFVVQETSSMTVSVSPGVAVTKAASLMLLSDSRLITIVPNSSAQPRIDTLQIVAKTEEFEDVARAQNNPLTGIVTVSPQKIKKRFTVDVLLKVGLAGSAQAPASDPQAVKIAEILVLPNIAAITQASIKNPDSTLLGFPNSLWTNDQSSTVLFDSLFNFKRKFRSSHTETGDHQIRSISDRHLDWGTAQGQVNALNIPVGGQLDIPGIPSSPSESIVTTLRKLADSLSMTKFLPVGTILMFDGTSWADNITLPGWYACIAQNASFGCPDLVDKFIKGSTVSRLSGGSDTVTLSTANLPLHSHSIDHSHTASSDFQGQHSHFVGAHVHSIDHNHGPTDSAPGGVDHSHTGVTGLMSANYIHSHDSLPTHETYINRMGDWFSNHYYLPPGRRSQGYVEMSGPIEVNNSSIVIFRTSDTNINHTHEFSTGGASAFAHTHPVSVPPFAGISGPCAPETNATGYHSHGVTVEPFTGSSGLTGGNAAFPIIPTYFTMIFIRKCS